MSSTCSEQRRGARCTALLSLLLGACSHLPAPRHPRPALPLPAALAAHYALPGPVQETALVPVGETGELFILRGSVECEGERAEFRCLVPKAAPPGPRPFVLCLPILAGGRELMWFVALDLAAAGHIVAWPDRVASALRPGQHGAQLEQLFRRTVVHNRMVLAWARRQPEIDARQMGCVGISMGGIVGGVLAALEPDVAGTALCLAGGNLPDLLQVSDEERARSWRHGRRASDGLAGSELTRELEVSLRSDPARFGPYVPTEKVLLVGGRFDRVVPIAHQDRLWESLGRPQRRMLPLGHYTSALAFGTIMGGIEEFLRGRFRAAIAGES